MESICDEKNKLEELHMKVMKCATGGRQALTSLLEFRNNCDTKWFDTEMICYLLRENVFQLLDWTGLEFYYICDRFSLSSAVNVQNALERLLDSMENQLKTKQWGKHRKLCELIGKVLWKCNDRHESTYQVYARLLDYIMKLIDLSKDEKLIDSALRALLQFPFNHIQSSLQKLIDSIGFYTDQCHWRIQTILCYFIDRVLFFKSETLDQQTSRQLFDYLRKLIDCCDDDETIECASSALTQFPASQILSQVYQPLLQNYMQSSQLNWKMHRNWLTFALLRWDKEYGDFEIFNIFKQIEDNLLEYLRKIIRQCDHMPLVLVAILLLERLYLKGYFNIESEIIENIKNELMGRVQSLDSECPLASDLPDEFDFDRYQVEWCARWCVHNVMDRHKRKVMGGQLPVIKLSNDRFEARSDQNYYNLFIPFRSQFAVSSGVYFYEVTVVTSGKMKFGWSSFDARFDDLRWKNYMGNMSEKFECDCNYIFTKLFDKPGDVIGCLIDNRKFVFYCNGKEVMRVDDKKIINSSSLYNATALLTPNQHCYFNFGQVEFKFPPTDIPFMDFHKASGQNKIKYQLTDTGISRRSFWFKRLPVGNKVDLILLDKRQKECDKLVMRVKRDIAEGREVEEMEMELGCTRYIQAIIEEMGKTIQKDKIDLMAQWVGRVIGVTIDRLNKANLVQLLYPYLHLRINSKLDYTKHRNICIVLSNLVRFLEWNDYVYIRHIRNEVFTYLTRTLTKTSDEWTQLFGLIALDNLILSDDEKKKIQEDTKFIEILNENCRFKIKDILSTCSPLSPQLHFSIEHLLTELHSLPPPRPNPAALNSNDRTFHLKLSLDLFSARSDWKWQSVRSTGRVTKGIYYFEAVLLTNGPMRIGWSTKRTEIERTEVGGDEFSVAFDGYSRAVWHNDTKLELESSVERWKEADVVGCLIRVTRNRENNDKVKHFCFFLNGHLLSYQAQSPIYSSPHPYHASISLSAHQQVFLNFGQVKFQHKPIIDYSTFFDYAHDFTNQSKSIISFNNSKFTNAVISIESTSTIGNVSMINHITSSTVENIPKQEFTSKCITYRQPQLAITSSDPSNHNTSSKNNPNNQKLLDNPALTSISFNGLKVDRDEHDSQSTSVCENEDCKQKYAILLEKYKQLKRHVALIEENAKLKQRIAELETEGKNKIIKSEKCDKIMPSTSTITDEHDAQQQIVMSIEDYTRVTLRNVELEKFVEKNSRE